MSDYPWLGIRAFFREGFIQFEIGEPKDFPISKPIAKAIRDLSIAVQRANYRLYILALPYGGDREQIPERLMEGFVQKSLDLPFQKFKKTMEEQGFVKGDQKWVRSWYIRFSNEERYFNLHCSCMFFTPKEAKNRGLV